MFGSLVEVSMQIIYSNAQSVEKKGVAKKNFLTLLPYHPYHAYHPYHVSQPYHTYDVCISEYLINLQCILNTIFCVP